MSDERKTRQSLKASGSNKGCPPKLDRKVEEDLIAENQRLLAKHNLRKVCPEKETVWTTE
jgi:hypothetical protein